MFFADVIFPVFTAPYVVGLFMPWLLFPAVVSELIVFKVFFCDAEWRILASTVLGANGVSWLLGIIIGCLLPTGLRQAPGTVMLEFAPGMLIWAFTVAFTLSVIIESWIWWISRKALRSRRLLVATLMANVASYGVLIIGIKLVSN